MDIIETAQDKMNKTIAVLNRDLGSLRAGRANPKLLDRIMVDYYGTPTPINQMGTVSSPEPRLLVISLWDASMISAAEKAIQKSDLGINPSNDGKLIRLVFPELTEERRKELVKIVRKKAEESKVAVRELVHEALQSECFDYHQLTPRPQWLVFVSFPWLIRYIRYYVYHDYTLLIIKKFYKRIKNFYSAFGLRT